MNRAFIFYLYPISSDKTILLLVKLPVPKPISFPSELNKLASATNKSFDRNFTLPTALIEPLLTGLIKFMLKDVVSTNTSSTKELTAKKQASSSNLKYTEPCIAPKA